MLVERKKLDNELYKLIEEFAMDSKVKDQVKQDLSKHNIHFGEVGAIFTRQIPLETVDINVLLLFTKSFHAATGKEVINPEKYFTELELSEAKDFKREKENITTEVVFENAIPVAVDQWIASISAKEISKLYGSGRIYYNPITQRGMRAKKSGDTVIQLIDIRDTAVNEISKKMLDGSYISNAITFNILKNDEDEFEYDSKNQKLSISEKSEIDVVDGFHRSYAILKALTTNPDLDLNMEVRIVNWDVEKARRFIFQEDLRTPIRKEYKASLNESNFYNQTTKELNEKAKNELQWKIATDNNLIKYNLAYTLFDTVSSTLDICYDLKSQRDVRKTVDYLVEYFNELIGILKSDFDKLEESRKFKVSTQPNIFIGYIALAAKLQNTENWESKLEDILKKADFSIDNSVWKDLDLFNVRLGKRGYNKIISYFNNLII